MKNILFILLLISIQQLIYAQRLTLTGLVTSQQSKHPVPYCSVQIEGKNAGTITDDIGGFTITIQDSCYLLVTRIGFNLHRIKINKETQVPLIIVLEPKEFSLQDIEIIGRTQNPVGTSLISSKQVKQLAGTFKDIMRAIPLIPGVSNNNEANARFNVRGGTYDENLITINGCRTYSPYHLKLIAASSSISVFNLDMTNQINFIAGGFSANYGNALSAVMDIKYETGQPMRTTGLADVSLMDLSLFLKGPFNKKLSYMLGFKRSNLAYFAELLDISSIKNFYYYDLQGNFNYQLNTKNKLDFTFIYSYDRLKPTILNEEFSFNNWWEIGGVVEQAKRFNTNNKNADGFANSKLATLHWNRKSDHFKLDNTFSFYSEKEDGLSSAFSESSVQFNNHPEWMFLSVSAATDSFNYVISTYNWKTDVTYFLSEKLLLNGGFLLENELFNQYRATNEQMTTSQNISYYPDTLVTIVHANLLSNDTINYELNEYKAGTYLRMNLMPIKNVFIDLGARVDYYSYNQNLNISPRFSFRYNLPYNFVFKGATGLFSQTPFLPSMSYFDVDTIRPDNQKAIHYILGLEKEIGKHTLIKVESYYKDYLSILPAMLSSKGSVYYTDTEPTEGYARGVDLTFSTKIKWLSFALSYSLAEAKEKYQVTDSTEIYCPRYSDQRHRFSLQMSTEFGRDWELVVKYFYGSGYAYTPAVIEYNEEFNMDMWIPGDKNSAHYPAYSRLDIALYKAFKLRNRYDLKAYVEVINVLNKKNVLSYTYTYNANAEPVIEANSLFPLIPSLGISFKF